MKKLNKAFVLFFSVLALFSCENDPIVFDNYDYSTCSFPYQSPARTIILGNYEEGFNDNDNNHQFEIGVVLTGVQNNKVNRKVYFEVDTTLLSNVLNVKYLPTSHYSIETSNPVIIPKGSTKGRIVVKLTDAFFNDPKSVSNFYKLGALAVCNYAIPMKITKVEGIDSILVGKAIVANPIRNVPTHWKVLPKDYTLFAVKYVNKFHGNYLRRGADKLSGLLLDTIYGTKYYRNQYAEKNELIAVSTVDLNTVIVPNIIRRYNKPNGTNLNLRLQFSADNSCKVFIHSTNEEIGVGKLKENSDVWGGKLHDAIYLQYSYVDMLNSEIHEVKDTMVIRDRAIGFETFLPTLMP